MAARVQSKPRFLCGATGTHRKGDRKRKDSREADSRCNCRERRGYRGDYHRTSTGRGWRQSLSRRVFADAAGDLRRKRHIIDLRRSAMRDGYHRQELVLRTFWRVTGPAGIWKEGASVWRDGRAKTG